MASAVTDGWRQAIVLRSLPGAPVGFAYGSQLALRGVFPDDEF
jgi:hypothetical protein